MMDPEDNNTFNSADNSGKEFEQWDFLAYVSF